MHIRPETPADYSAIRAINVAAFLHHPFSRQTEHLIVEELRKAGALAVSLVAEDESGRVVGHIAFSVMQIDGRDLGWYMAGPLAVMPECQKKGIGSALVRAGLEAIRALGASGCFLVGDPAFYTRLGFANEPLLTMQGVPPEVCLAYAFVQPVPQGAVTHHPAFLAGL